MHAMEIVLIEDNRGDVLLLTEALRQVECVPQMTVAGDGMAGLALLRERAAASPPQLPDLILLDLNLPRMDGWEVLRHLKAEPVLRAVPTAILTSSKADRHLMQAHDLPADRYLIKPASFQGFLELAGRIAGLLAAEAPI